jgi:ankyrin repeat protein
MQMDIRRLGLIAAGLLLGWSAAANAAERDLRLVSAAQERNVAGVKWLLTEGVDVNAPRADGATALFWAVHWDDAETVDLLLRAHANANAADDHGVTPLDLACENANAAVVERLLAAGADARHVQRNGATPLATAARTGNVAIVKTLLAHGADVNASIPENGQTALMWATAERHPDVMRTLIAAGANVHARSKIGFTPLLFAARNGDLEAAKLLIAAGVDVNEAGSDGTHALPLAIISAHDDFALFLLEQKADANGTMAGVTALHAAAGAADMWIREWYRARGVDYSRTAPSLAPKRRVALIKALSAHGADPNARIVSSAGVQGWLTLKNGAFEPFSVGTGNLRGATPLWVAAFDMHGGVYGGFGMRDTSGVSEKPEIVRTLLAVGANPSVTTDDKTTPLMAAAGLGHGTYLPGQKRGAPTPDAEATVKLLVEAGADINATNEAGFTALHGAAFKGLNEVVEYLVSKGADINAQDFMKRTAYRMAEGSKQTFQFQEWPETAQLLKQLGADISLGISGRDQERQRDAAGNDAAKRGRNNQ